MFARDQEPVVLERQQSCFAVYLTTGIEKRKRISLRIRDVCEVALAAAMTRVVIQCLSRFIGALNQSSSFRVINFGFAYPDAIFVAKQFTASIL